MKTKPNQRFWVVGGEYHDSRFNAGNGEMTALGPYASYDEAKRVWTEHSVATRAQAMVRYTIAVEQAMAS